MSDYASFERFSDKELHIISCLAKYIKREAEDFMRHPDGWRHFIEELNELIETADLGLSASLISKLYQTSPL